MSSRRRNEVDNNVVVQKWFEDLKSEILKIDPVSFAESFLTIDGKPFKMSDGGWRFLSDIYRYIAIEATTAKGKPVVISKGRQVGMTTMAAALELYFTTCGLYGISPEKPPMRILHCFPALALVQKYSKDKLETMMRTSKEGYVASKALNVDEKTGRIRGDVHEDTLTEKQFRGENKIWIDSNANDAARLHGMTLDAIFYDEVQRMNQDDIGNSKRTLTAAKYGPRGQGIQLYFGTPLQRGSYFQKMWEASDQRIYHLGCENCKEFFPLFIPGSDSWEQTWIYGNIVVCSHCQHQQVKEEAVERGKWIATKKDPTGSALPYIGFHVNQLLIPGFTKEVIMREKPGIHPTNSDRIWRNEILGEFYSGSDLPMSEEEIHENCRNINKRMSTTSTNENNLDYFMGVDWGLKTDSNSVGKSFSAVVVISVDRAGTINVENAFKLKKNDLQHKKDVVAEMYRRFGLKVAVADFGYANDLIPEIQKDFGARFLSCQNSYNVATPYRYYPEELRLTCNTHIILEELFGHMKRGRVLFPWADYEKIQWLVEHCCSMEKENKTVQGQVINRYVKGSSPNDGLMALYYAYIAYRFYQTKGFSLKAHQIYGNKQVSTNKVPILLAHLPNI